MNTMKVMDFYGKYNKGDWIRFYKHQTMVIGQVEYFYQKERDYKQEVFAATELGPVNVDDILEYRSA